MTNCTGNKQVCIFWGWEVRGFILHFEKNTFHFDVEIAVQLEVFMYMICIFILRELNKKVGTVEPNEETFNRCVLDGNLECQIGGNYWGRSKSISNYFILCWVSGLKTFMIGRVSKRIFRTPSL